MRWSNVMLIYARELRDQLRDRRTLFTILVLPLVLYPLMGMALLQVSQFMREHPTRIWLMGTQNLPDDVPLVDEDGFAEGLVDARLSQLIQLDSDSGIDSEFQKLIESFRGPQSRAARLVDQMMQQEMRDRSVDLAVVIPQRIPGPASAGTETAHANPPRIYIFRNSASDKSNIAAERATQVLKRWQDQLTRTSLAQHGLDLQTIRGFELAHADVADQQSKRAVLWSKILPFIVMIWCLTGAFYPAVDLCAGEKERGTFETLLSSPARRDEIAIGKLLTVMSFSMATSVLNLISMGFTGAFVMSRLGAAATGGGIGAPPLGSMLWLLLALVPVSALFSAVALAAASFARSSKEGQYYLVPLMMISMPLMMLPMLPAAELDLGTSLIPVSGLMMLLRGLIEGEYSEAAQYAGPVVAVTLVCCWLAIRWVVSQFNSESVLFRSSERFGVGAWLRHVMRQRHDTPSIGHAVLCAVLILVIKFFVGLVAHVPASWADFSKQTIVILVATVGTPAVLMAMVLTRDPIKTLRLRTCRWSFAAAAVLMAACLHPLVMGITSIVIQLYPPSGDMAAMDTMMRTIMGDAPGFWAILLVFALAPAVLEEMAFRGFILSGFQSFKSDWKAILVTSILFGVAHSVLQQSIVTFFVGMVLGVIAVRTRSLIPCVLYHATHNGLSVMLSQAGAEAKDGMFGWFLSSSDGVHVQYAMGPAIILTALGLLLVIWMWRFEDRRPADETGGTDRRGLRPMLDAWLAKFAPQSIDR